MKEDVYESGECTDDGFSESSIDAILIVQDNIKKKKKKKKQKEKKRFLPTIQYHKFIKQHYFNPYIYQRVKGNTNFTQTKSLLTDLINGVGNKKNFEERTTLQNEAKFSIKKVDLKKFEYLSYIKFHRNECYSPDPYNPIKINLKTNLKTFTGNTKSLENYFEISNKTRVNKNPESIIYKLCGEIDSFSRWQDLLLDAGISNEIVNELINTFVTKTSPVSPIHNVDLEQLQIAGSQKELSDDDMDISEEELENIPIVVDHSSNSEISLRELRNSNSLYMRDYSPEHISYYDFVTNFGTGKSTNQIFYECFKN